ncbi:putative gustatory receptor 98d [Drosophila subpulchrella]|uniref:putative gustatory receptor 98d n=1 Tax=Drosophila subpulchrella TaxID=1486046 RepID=UPI0018A1ACD1|nr:putative gustatory receptor 98d [Drosophila subpulchrella]
MEVNRSRLLTTARPYLQVLSILGLTPPPVFFTRTLLKRRRGYLIAGYTCYLLAILLVIIYECYANIVALHQEVDLFRADDFSRVMGRTQKVLVVAMAICNQLNMLFNFRRLARIYEDIADLEKDINNSLPGFTVRVHWWSFRYRIAIFVGLWIVLLVGLTPRFTLVGLGPFLHWTNKVLTELVLIMTQLKSAEYCVFVLLIFELILQLRHILQQIVIELEDCNCSTRIQEMCVTLKRNQLLVGRIWSLVGEIGEYFTLSMTLLFVYNGLTIPHVVNWALIKSVNPNDCCQYMRIGVTLLLSINIFLACSYSELCIQAYNSIPRILHQIYCLPATEDYQMLKMGLREYSLQMQHLKLRFTCGGLFDINLKYFGGMVVTIFGYIIILIQFKMHVFAQSKYMETANISELKAFNG